MKKLIAIFGILIVSSGLILFGSHTFGDDITSTPSNRGEATEGAWYDELWQAQGFYRIKRDVGTNDFRYEYTTDPTTSSSTTFYEEGELVEKDTEEEEDHKHEFKDTTGGASIPQDMVVTEWLATGHVHFASEL